MSVRQNLSPQHEEIRILWELGEMTDLGRIIVTPKKQKFALKKLHISIEADVVIEHPPAILSEFDPQLQHLLPM